MKKSKEPQWPPAGYRRERQEPGSARPRGRRLDLDGQLPWKTKLSLTRTRYKPRLRRACAGAVPGSHGSTAPGPAH